MATREALINKIKDSVSYPEILLPLAQSPCSASDLQSLVERESAPLALNHKKLKVLRFLESLAPTAFIVTLLVVVIMASSNTDKSIISYWPLWLIVGTVLLSIGIAYLEVEFATKTNAGECRIEYALPISGTQECNTVLEYLESGYADVLAWRDIALAEREQLHYLDVAIMQALYLQEQAQHVAMENARKNEEAFNKLHGLVPA